MAHAGGKPRFVPTAEQHLTVAVMISGGIPHDAICRAILKPDGKPITGKTLRKAFRTEIDSGGADAHGQVVKTLFQKALGGDTTAIIWYTKTRMGWRETVVNANLNLPSDSAVADDLIRRLVPEFADRGKTAPDQGDAGGEANGADVHVGVLGSNGAASSNGHG